MSAAARLPSPLPWLASIVEGLSRGLAFATVVVAVVLSAGFVASLLLQIFFRYALNSPLTWTGEVAVLQFLWTMLLLASLGVREGFHVRLTFVIERLPSRAAAMVEALLTATITLFGGFMVAAGSRFVELTWGNTSAAIEYPMQVLYLAAPCGGALIVVHGVARLLAGLRGGGPA